MLSEKLHDFFPSSQLITESNKAVVDTNWTDTLLIQWGSTTITTSTSGGKFGYYAGKSITFPTAFKSAPRGFATIDGTAGYWSAGVSTTSETAMTINVGGDSKTTVPVRWLAIGWEA